MGQIGGKAPALGGNSYNALKLAVKIRPIFKLSMVEGSALRPLEEASVCSATEVPKTCPLDILGKILERFAYDRLPPLAASGPSNHQYGFWRARSTINAVTSGRDFFGTRSIAFRKNRL